ncbi:MAG: CPBP family intramembrane metalloprotease [Desulfurococcales archaeon]|nr:CPBP family intramembrane metalloprotease [Desulfurococcales archaeon]
MTIIIIAITIWAGILIPGTLVGVIISKKTSEELLSGAASQLTFIVMSLTITVSLTNGFEYSGLRITFCCLFEALLYSGALAIVIALASMVLHMQYDYEPPFLPRRLIEAVLVAFLLAPFSEELMYRGVVEGYLLSHTSLATAILVPAILFSLMHIIPFNNAPRPVLATVLTGALLLGVIAGYYRAISNSIIPAFASHSTSNIIGFLQYYKEKNIYQGKH